MILQPQELGFQGKNIQVNAGEGTEIQAAKLERGKRN